MWHKIKYGWILQKIFLSCSVDYTVDCLSVLSDRWFFILSLISEVVICSLWLSVWNISISVHLSIFCQLASVIVVSPLIAFTWVASCENVICTQTFFSGWNVVRKWEVKMNCRFYWHWKPSSYWRNETGNNSLSKTITQPLFLFLFHWLDSWKQGGGGKKSNQSRTTNSHGHSGEITEKVYVWGKDGKKYDEMEYKTADQLSCRLISPSLSGHTAFSKLCVDEQTCNSMGLFKVWKQHFFFKHIYIPPCIPPVRLNKRASKGKEWLKMGIPVCFLCVIHKLRPKESITSPQ